MCLFVYLKYNGLEYYKLLGDHKIGGPNFEVSVGRSKKGGGGGGGGARFLTQI